MKIETFLNLQAEDIAAVVREKGPRVVVCPINGTRRWFMLESRKHGFHGDFLDTILARYLSLFELFFSHGITNLLTPVLGPDIVQRGSTYTRMVFSALERISTGENFIRFYENKDVRVRFYGDYEQYMAEHAPEVLGKLAEVQAATREHLAFKLFWGMFANDPVEKIARRAVDFYKLQGETLKRPDIVTHYYGEYLPPADMFIGMMPPAVFDFPLLDVGHTALYFTTAPTPYLDETMLRRMLYDFIFVRRVQDDYDDLDEDDWRNLEEFYSVHQREIFGVGRRAGSGSVWLPGANGDS